MTPRDLALKAATRLLARRAGGVTAAAGRTRVPASILSRYGAPHLAMQMPADVIADLEAAAGDPVLTRHLADLAGYVLVPRAAAEHPRAGLAEAAAPLMHQAGAALVLIAEAASDGRICRREAAAIAAQTHRTVEAATALDHAADALAASAR